MKLISSLIYPEHCPSTLSLSVPPQGCLCLPKLMPRQPSHDGWPFSRQTSLSSLRDGLQHSNGSKPDQDSLKKLSLLDFHVHPCPCLLHKMLQLAPWPPTLVSCVAKCAGSPSKKSKSNVENKNYTTQSLFPKSLDFAGKSQVSWICWETNPSAFLCPPIYAHTQHIIASLLFYLAGILS